MEKFGKYRGIVTNNNDPLKSGRLMVIVPDVSGPLASWAMPCLPCAGKGLAYSAIPDIGAGVWVEYEGGDLTFPVWSGCYLKDGQIIEKLDDTRAASGIKHLETSKGLMITFNGEQDAVDFNDNIGNQILSIDLRRKEIRLSANYKVVTEGRLTEVGEHSVPPDVSVEDLISYLTQFAATYNTHIHPGGPATPPVPAANPPVSQGNPAPLVKDHFNTKLPVLNEFIKDSLHEFVFKAQNHKLRSGKNKIERSITVLLIGFQGTGKAMAAEYVAKELSLNLYRIDMSSVVSKFIGETEKNLERILSETDAKDVVLFFDEADPLFGKRSEVKEAHDRYANVNVSYLLQAFENYKGIVLFACNSKRYIDPAFIRRMHYVLEFPPPETA